MDSDSDDDSPPPPLVRSSPSNDIVVRPGMTRKQDLVDSEEEVEDEIPLNASKCQDLFSQRMFESARDCLRYCKNVHGFNLKILRKRHSLDCFSFIRMVNYLRSEKPSPGLVMSLSSDTLWKDEAYMKPTVDNDPLLMVDIEDDLSDLDEEEEVEIKKMSLSDDQKESESDLDKESSPSTETESLRNEIAILRRQLDLKNQQLEMALEDMDKMRHVTRAIFEEGDAKVAPAKEVKSVGDLKETGDESYGGSYAHFGIHHDMLSDQVRTESYRDAVKLNAEAVEGKKVLDLGCGTSILSMFCARYGLAGHVIGVDMSDIAHQAMDIVRENGLENSITILKGKLEDINVHDHMNWDPAKFDILISEWMGYFLLFEGMLDSVIAARDKYLVPGALILPNRCTMHLVGVCDPERYKKTVGYFDDVYGFKMSCLRGPMIKEASVEVVKADKCVTNIAQIHTLDITTCSLNDTEFQSDFELTAEKDADITAIAGYFDTFFDDPRLKNPVVFSTGPVATPTHWKQTLFYLDEVVSLKSGQVVKGTIKVSRPLKDVRAIDVKITLEGRKSQKFCL